MFISKKSTPYFLKGSNIGILLIHGLTGSPAQMRLLADYLHDSGFSILAVRLSGHGTEVSDLACKNWQDWFKSVQDGYYQLKSCCDKIFVVGLSLGGLLALKLATHFTVDKLVIMSTPIQVYDKRFNFVQYLRFLKKYNKKRNRYYNVGDDYNDGYEKYPLSALCELKNLIEVVKADLTNIKVPILIIQSKTENTVVPKSASYIYDKISSHQKQLLWLDNFGHMIILEENRQMVFAKTLDFFKGEQR